MIYPDEKYPDEKYHGYTINIRHEGHIGNTTFYQTTFTVSKDNDNKGFYLLCQLSHLKVGAEYKIPVDVPGALKEAGLKKVHELIDLQQFENEDEYTGEVEFDGKSWRCVITGSIRVQ